MSASVQPIPGIQPLRRTQWYQRLARAAGLSRGCVLVAGLLASTVNVAEEAPGRVHDLAYGAVLYEYYQGNAFEALSRLDVANLRGGITGHGDHPLLVEGGLMLSYGMTREAKALFEKVLQDNVSEEKRNEAWFYLGKVFYLEQDHSQASDALGRVNGELLEDEDDELYYEWLYLQGQLALASESADLDELVNRLPDESLWRAYLVYNRAMKAVADGQQDEALVALALLADELQDIAEDEEDPTEAAALRERTLLTAGQLYLQQGRHDEARANLQKISLDSLFSDQALFHFAVAAANEKDYGLALQALNTLNARPLFTPWLQQVPFARGFVFEQLDDRRRALQAYQDAAGHYETLAEHLATERSQLTEDRLVASLRFNETLLLPTDGQGVGNSQNPSGLLMRQTTINNDPYGRLQVQPDDFSLAALLATETFQLGLRDLHELYRLQRSLERWQQQLGSFDIMLETRSRLRNERITATREALEAQQADQWVRRQAGFNQRIEQALAEENARFFMTDEEIEFDRTIQSVLDRLAGLPDDERTASHRERIRRIKAFFDWRVEDRYGVNRWAAQKQVRELNEAMGRFTGQQAALADEMASDDRNQALSQRVEQNQRRLMVVKKGLESVLNLARQKLMTQVRAELERQEREVRGYLTASRHAQARLADDLFKGASAPLAPEPSAGSGEQP